MCVIKHAFCLLMLCSLMLPLSELGCTACVAAVPCYCVDACTCVPNKGQFGYFTSQWRQWPSLSAAEPTASQPMLAPEASMQAPSTDEADGSDGPLASPLVSPLADPPMSAPVDSPAITPPVNQPTEDQPPALPLPASSAPVDGESTPAPSPKDSDSGRFDPRGGLPERALAGSPVSAIHERARQPVEPQLGPVRMAEQASHHDLIQPWAEPRPSRKPVPPQRRESPPGLRGFCAVQLMENESWVVGDSRCAVEYGGRVYLMSGPRQQRQFLENPGRYAPVLSGNDPVLVVDEGRQEPGRTDYCVIFDGRLYSFSSNSTLARFRKAPERYAAIAKGSAY